MGYKSIDSGFMNKHNSRWIGCLLIILFSLFFSGQVLAAVSLAGSTQSPPNDVIDGTNVSYSMTIEATADHFVSLQITDNGQPLGFGSISADTPGCTFDGATVFCGQQAAGTTKAYNFSWRLPPTEGTHDLDFIVNCGFQCTGFTNQITTIVRASQPGVLQFSSTTFQAAEGAGATVTVTRTGGSDGTLTADVAIGGGNSDTASAADYTLPANTTVTFPPNVTSQTVTIPLLTDALVEGDETLSLALIGDAGVVGTPRAAVLTIIDNTPQPGTLQFSADTYQGTEGASATITVTRTGGSDGELSASIVLGGGNNDTASQNDFTQPTVTTVTFPDGVTAPRAFVIPLNADALVEGNETLTLSLTGSAGVIGTPGVAQLTIIDNPPNPVPGTLQFSADTFQGTEGTSVTITVTRTGGSDGALSADVIFGDGNNDTASSNDYTQPANATLSFADGDTTSKTIAIPLNTDAQFNEGNETLTLTLVGNTGVVGTPGVSVLTIIDNTLQPQPGTLQFSADAYQGTEGASVTVTVTRTGGSDGELSVGIQLGGGNNDTASDNDFTQPTITTLTFADGDTAPRGFVIPLDADALVEGNETLTLTLTGNASVVGTPGVAILTIVDATPDPVPGTLQFSSDVYQGTEGTSATITVTRTGGSDGILSANITLGGGNNDTASGNDYSQPASTTVTFANGDASAKQVTIPLNTDALVEGDETLTLTLAGNTGVVGTPGVAILTIIDPIPDSVPGTLQFSSDVYQGTEGASATITVTRTGGSDGILSANITLGGGANDTASGNDYSQPANTTVTFANGDASAKQITIPLNPDALVEGDETLTLTLTGNTAVVGAPGVAVLTIVDATPDSVPGDLQFSSATYQGAEGTTVTITVTRTGGSDGEQTANIVIGSEGDTASTADYTPPANTTVTFADGDAIPKTISIPLRADALTEGNETLSLALQQGRGPRAIGTPSTATLTIIDADNDNGADLGFSSDAFTVSEQNGEAVITVARSGSPEGSLSATVEITGDTATQDEDYQDPSILLLTWGDGDGAPKEIRIPILADNKVEADETVTLILRDSQGQVISTVSLTITDNPPVADNVDVVSGGQQKGASGTTLTPFAIRVLDAAGNAIEGALVTWTIEPASGGSLSAGSETTSDVQGASNNTLTLNTSGRVVVTARASEGEDQRAIFIVNRSLIDTPQLTGNQRIVATAFDIVCAALAAKQASEATLTPGETDLLSTCDKLAAASDADVAEGLNRLAPDEISAQGTASIKAANLQVTNVNSRLNALRSGLRGMSLSGLNMNLQGEAIPGSVLDAMLAGEDRGGSAGDEMGGRSPWGGFINGEISFGDKDDTNREPGFDFDTTGITAGIDYRISNNIVVGGAVGYGINYSDFNDGASNMEMKGYHLTGYGTYYRNDNFYMDGLIKLGWNNYDTSRRVNLPGDPLQKAEGDTDSFEYSFSLTGGYEVNRDSLTLGGYGRLSYTKVEIDGYSESASNPGVPGFGSVLKLADQDVDSLTTTLGGTVSYAISTTKAVFMPQFRLEWEHEFNDDERAIDAQFIHDPSSTTFGVLTDEPDKDYFNVGLGFSVITRNGKSGFLNYETRIDQDNIEQHWIKAGVRFEF